MYHPGIGFRVLDALEHPEAPEAARALPTITTLRRTWQQHDERTEHAGSASGPTPILRVRFKASRDLQRAAKERESPYDTDTRYRHKRDTQWTGIWCTLVKHASRRRPMC